MKKQYTITGMTCGGCVANVKKALENIPEVNSAQIQLNAPEGTLTFEKEVAENQLQQKLSAIGNYTIKENKQTPNEEIKEVIKEDLPKKKH